MTYLILLKIGLGCPRVSHRAQLVKKDLEAPGPQATRPDLEATGAIVIAKESNFDLRTYLVQSAIREIEETLASNDLRMFDGTTSLTENRLELTKKARCDSSIARSNGPTYLAGPQS